MLYEMEIQKITKHLAYENNYFEKIKQLDALRYFYKENEKEEERVIYNKEKDELEYSNSIKIAIEITKIVPKVLKEIEDNKKIEAIQIMQNNYYYLAAYLFSYYMVAIEFGIPPEKQFFAPRTSVLGPISKKLEKFYYKPKAVMTISMPQGTGKTEIGKRFMSFCVGKAPDLPNMMVSYSATIAKDKFYNGEITLIEDENGNYQKIFPNLDNVLKSAENMTLDYRNDGKKRPHSEYTLYCCGFDGGITGRTRAHNVLYIDDLIKNIEEARNKDVLDKKWDEFTGTLKKRMQGNCKMLIIGTIFSINDPLSRIIKYYKDRDPDRIEVVRVPGLNENNETNFNYKYGFALTTEALLEDKDLMDTVSFECLIQQNPIERLGIVFSEEELTKFLEEPEYGLQRRISAVDVAWGGGDSLAMPICSEYDNHDVYLTDVVFSKAKKEETIPLVVNAIINYQITTCHFEANNGGDMYAEKVQEELKKRNYRCNITWSKVPTTKSKLDRILACQGAIKGEAKSDYRLLVKERKIIKNNKMYNDFLDELTKFNQAPNMQGKQHDDAPDALASLFTNVLGYVRVGRARSSMSREDLGI